jgi:hypothetical protein
MLSNATMTTRLGGSPPKLTILPPRARYRPPYARAVAGSLAITALSACGFVTTDSAMKYAGTGWIVMRCLPIVARILNAGTARSIMASVAGPVATKRRRAAADPAQLRRYRQG